MGGTWRVMYPEELKELAALERLELDRETLRVPDGTVEPDDVRVRKHLAQYADLCPYRRQHLVVAQVCCVDALERYGLARAQGEEDARGGSLAELVLHVVLLLEVIHLHLRKRLARLRARLLHTAPVRRAARSAPTKLRVWLGRRGSEAPAVA